MTMEFIEPWESINLSQKATFEREIKREMTRNHLLNRYSFITAIGKHGGSDDILFQVENNVLVVVHLTWREETDSSFPRTTFYKDWNDFLNNRMKPDNLDYQE